MATYQNTTNNSFEAGDSGSTIYRFAAVAVDGQADLVGTQGNFTDGIFAETVSAGQAVGLVKPDYCVAKLEAGDAITAGDELISDNVGRGITAAGVGAVKMAKALNAASAAGEIISVIYGYRGEVSA